jgi:hypothetical protein
MSEENKTVLVDITVSNNQGKTYESVTVKVHQEGDQIHAIPILDESTRRSLKLPAAFSFRFFNHCIIPGKGTTEEDMELMKEIVMGMG